MTGLPREEALGETLQRLFSRYERSEHREEIAVCLRRFGHWQGELSKTVGGERKTNWFAVTAVNDSVDNRSGYVAIAWDSSPVDESYPQSLPSRALNRSAFLEGMRSAIARASQFKSSLGVVCLRVDGLARMSMALSVETKDGLIASIAELLRRHLTDSGIVATLGEDEFGVVCVELERLRDTSGLLDKTLLDLREMLEARKTGVPCSINVGMSHYPNDGEDSEALLRKAELAARHVHRLDGDGYAAFSRSGFGDILDPLGVANDLVDALLQDDFTAIYQPVYDLSSAQVVSAEALIRWEHPTLGKLKPGQFGDVARHVGAWVEIGHRVIERTCRQISRWSNVGVTINVSVNLAMCELLESTLLDRLAMTLAETGIEPARLCFELAHESIVPPGGTERMSQLSHAGFALALDDFGTGDLTLEDAKAAGVEHIKIHADTWKDVVVDGGDASSLKEVIASAERLGVAVIAKGVESREQLDGLVKLGCGWAQGRFLCKPKQADWLTIMLLQDQAP